MSTLHQLTYDFIILTYYFRECLIFRKMAPHGSAASLAGCFFSKWTVVCELCKYICTLTQTGKLGYNLQRPRWLPYWPADVCEIWQLPDQVWKPSCNADLSGVCGKFSVRPFFTQRWEEQILEEMCIVREVGTFLRYFNFLQELVEETELCSGPRSRAYSCVAANILMRSGF